MRTWSLVQPATQRFAELTWSEYEVEVTLGAVGQAGETERRAFTRAEEIKEFIEDWLEELALDGFVEGVVEPAVNRDAPVPYAELEKRARALGSLGELVADDDVVVDPLETEEDDESYLDEEPDDDEPDYVEKPVVSLTVDEAFDERIKEDPYDVDVS